jgi:periplasmic nitrate reductase NapD
MPVSGVVVTCSCGRSAEVTARIDALDGIEVYGVLAGEQIVAVIEADTVQAEVDLVSRLHQVDGVVAVRLAYHNFEDVEP